jgi:hypothetical protein
VALKQIDSSLLMGVFARAQRDVPKTVNEHPLNEDRQQCRQVKGAFERWRETWLKAVLANRTLPAGAKVVATTISLHLNRDTRAAWPSIRTLNKESGLSSTAVQNGIKALERHGHLTIERKFKPETRRHAVNVYRPVGGASGTPCNRLRHMVCHPGSTEPLTDSLNEPSIQIATQSALVATRRNARGKMFAYARKRFGKDTGGLVYKLLQDCGGDAEEALRFLQEAHESGEGRAAIARRILYNT